MPERRGLVVGCGGTLGFAWSMAAIQSVENELGWDARTAEALVGTSAGSEVVALLGSGRSSQSIVKSLEGADDDAVLRQRFDSTPGSLPPMPAFAWPALGMTKAALGGRLDALAGLAGLLPRGQGDATFLREFGDGLAGTNGWVEHPATWLMAADPKSGLRTSFGSPEAPKANLGEALAASWSVPGWFPPVEIGGYSYIDGGAVSPTSADVLLPAGLDEVIIVAPMSTRNGAEARGWSRAERLVRTRMTRRVNAEQTALEAAGTRVIRVEPGYDELLAMGPNFMDAKRRDATLRTARQHTPGRVRRALNRGAHQ